MKEKIVAFFSGFLIYGLLGGLAMYYFEQYTFGNAIKFGVVWGFSMALAELFIYPKIKVFFSKKKEKI